MSAAAGNAGDNVFESTRAEIRIAVNFEMSVRHRHHKWGAGIKRRSSRRKRYTHGTCLQGIRDPHLPPYDDQLCGRSER
jgi:hypothetical protein